MPEGTPDATLLIATSWQALNRAIQGNKKTLICDCTVLILFAAFFIESNLNYIIKEMNQTSQMIAFLGKKKFPGMQDKLGWFYNQYVARSKAVNKKQLYNNSIEKKLSRKFPGFTKIYKFRNDISHGVVDRSVANLKDAMTLRKQAKDIVAELFLIAYKSGHDITRVINYNDAIAS